MERIEVTYKDGAVVEIEASNGTYKYLFNLLMKKDRPEMVASMDSSKYKYCIRLTGVVAIQKIN